MVYVSGDIYEGTWVNGFYKQGKKSYANGDIYEGEWLDGYYKKGKMSYANGDIYEGEWQLGKPGGKGKMSYSNGNTCEGNWYKGELSYGKMIYANGDTYEGAFSIGMPNGTGKMTYANGGFCEGKWKLNQFYSGKINIHYENGDIYEGGWKNNLKEGEGIITYANGEIEKVKYKKGKILNKKVTVYPDVDNISEFVGINYEDGTMLGNIKYKDMKLLDTYNGKMTEEYERHGQGTLSLNDYDRISTIEGLWNHDSLVSGSGKLVMLWGWGDTLEMTKEANQPFRIVSKLFNYDIVVQRNYHNIEELYEKIEKQVGKKRVELKELEEKAKKQEEEKLKKQRIINELTKKYGAKNTEYITKGIIKIGMTAEMLDEMCNWKKQRYTTANGIVEVWTYGGGYYTGLFGELIERSMKEVTLKNGKVIKIYEK